MYTVVYLSQIVCPLVVDVGKMAAACLCMSKYLGLKNLESSDL